MIPKHLQRPGMAAAEKKRTEAWVESKRKIMQKAPAYDELNTATTAAVQMAMKEELSLPSVWKEPEDIGKRYAVVHTDNRENALISGYTEKVNQQEVFDMAKAKKSDRYDEIEEVQKYNKHHGADGRFVSGTGGGGGSVLNSLSGYSNKEAQGKKVQPVNGGGPVTIGSQREWDGFATDANRIKRGEEYAVASVSRGTVKVGTYNGRKAGSLGATHQFTGRDGKAFSVDADSVHMNPIFNVK